MTGNRYSLPILGKYLVIIANPADYPMQAQLPVCPPFPGFSLPTNSTVMSVRRQLTGGHFSA